MPIQRVLAGVLLVGIVAGGLGGFLVSRSSIGLDEGRISTLIDQRIEATAPADDVSVTSVSLGPLVEKYLVENPRVLERISLALNAEIERERRAKSKAAIEENRELIYSGEGAVVVGNPNGDVTLVELYDYNCGYCRSSMPEVAALLAEDANLRLVLRQFPILSQGSVDAAKVGTLVAGEGVDYWTFHRAMFTSRGQVDGELALQQAAALGLDPEAIRARMGDAEVDATLAQSFQIAQALEISGTPTFIIGDEIIPGAVGVEVLREKIANMRACGSTQCPS